MYLYSVLLTIFLQEFVLISVSEATETLDGYTAESVIHGYCDVRPVVTVPANVHCHCSLAGRRSSWPDWLVTYQTKTVYMQMVTYLSIK